MTYFLTSLTRRGAPISLLGGKRGGEIMKDYIITTTDLDPNQLEMERSV